MQPVEEQLNCIHNITDEQSGLCHDCTVEYLNDPLWYWQYGAHPSGIARWEEISRLMCECCPGYREKDKVEYKPNHSFHLPF